MVMTTTTTTPPPAKKAVVTVRAKPSCRCPPTGTCVGEASNAPRPAAVEGRAAQHLTPYEVQGEANIVHNKAHMVALGVAGFARKTGLLTEHPRSPPSRLHPAPVRPGTPPQSRRTRTPSTSGHPVEDRTPSTSGLPVEKTAGRGQ
jgi:hypothetical protein